MGKQERIEPRKLKGFRDLLPYQARIKKTIIDSIWNNALLAGFEGIETPVIEYAETLLGTGEETDKEVYRFQDQGERNVALRFDLTVPFARYVAENYADLVFPFKKVQIGNAWRGEKPQKGRYREFCQADLDIVGVDSAAADIEVISCIIQNLMQLLSQPFTLSIGHRIILSSLIRTSLSGIEAGYEPKVLIAIDKLAKIGRAGVLNLLIAMPGVTQEKAELLLSRLEKKDAEGDTDLSALKVLFANDASVLAEVERLEQTALILRRTIGESHAKVKIDLHIARGLGYYTGIVFETTIDGLDGFGSISSGGRYNGLVSRFSSQELPGIGGSIGVDRLLAAMEHLSPKSQSERKGVFIAIASSETEARLYAFELLKALRAEKVISDIALKDGKLANQFKFADKKNYAWVLTLGEEEVQKKTVSLKNLATGQELRSIEWSKALETLL